MLAPQMPGFVVRPVSLHDAAAWAAYALLPGVMEFTSSTASSVRDVEAAIQRVIAAEATSPVHFVIFPEGSKELVATVGFHTVSPVHGTAEITYDVAPEHWGKGIATAACRAAVLWGFEKSGWNRVQATTVLPHVRSQRVLERCGFKREGLVRNFRLVRGKPTDYWLYSIVPGEVASEA